MRTYKELDIRNQAVPGKTKLSGRREVEYSYIPTRTVGWYEIDSWHPFMSLDKAPVTHL